MRGWRFEAFQEAQGKSIAQALVNSNPCRQMESVSV